MKPVVLALALLTAGSVTAELPERIDKQFQVRAGETLFLDLKTGGTVEMNGWNKNEVAVTAYPGGPDADECRVDILRVQEGVRIESAYMGRTQSHSTSFRFEISVPQEYNLAIESAGGDIAIMRVKGKFSGQTGGGKISIRESKGVAELSTGGGEILLEDSELDGEISTGGGNVLLRRVSGDVDASTGGGTVIREANLSKKEQTAGAKNSNGVLHMSTAGGPIRLETAPSGAEVSTGGGDIHIVSAEKFVHASTGGGSITIESMAGAVTATTGAGDISIQMAGESGSANHDVDLSSGSGDITLIVPDSFDATVFVKIGYTRGNEQSRIISDFQIEEERTAQWSSSEGTPRKYVYGKARWGNGTNRIRIQTVNGNVYLRKAKS